MLNSHKELIVWQKGIDLVINIYKLTEDFPKEELYGITSQMRRCAVSIPSNIAEGYNRRSKKEYAQFIMVAFGSGAELETQLIIAQKLKFLDPEKFKQTIMLLTEVMKMLNRLDFSLTRP